MEQKQYHITNQSKMKMYLCDKCKGITERKNIIFVKQQQQSKCYCRNCYVSEKYNTPISCSHEDWINIKRKYMNSYSSQDKTISCIPIDILSTYLVDYFFEASKEKNISTHSPYCSFEKKYLVYISRCVRVSKEWAEYFNNAIFWKPAFMSVAVNKFYERKKSILMQEKKKSIQSSNWTNEEIKRNKCHMIVVNKTKNIPFDIFWISKNETKTSKGECHFKHTVQGRRKYWCDITYPNAKWMCLPNKDWLQKNPYSTLGFTWTIDVFNLKTFDAEDGSRPLAYIVDIREPDLKKMLPIKDTTKTVANYKKKIIQIVYDKKEVEISWTKNRDARKDDIDYLKKLRKTVKKIRKDISISEKKSEDQLYILNMFD